MNTQTLKLALILIIPALLASCSMGDSNYMSKKQRRQIESAFDSLQNTYTQLMAQYDASPDSLSPEMNDLYTQMRQMHQQMNTNYHRMMSGSMNMNQRMKGNGMMSGSGGMGMMNMHMQGQMTGEWSQQMMAMHQQMADIHMKNGQKNMAMMNQKLGREYQHMMNLIPGSGKSSASRSDNANEEVPDEKVKDASTLNGQALFTQNCASCHGADAKGIAGVFPPLVNSPWVTGEKSIPIRIVQNGLTGNIEVNGQTYQGMMPSFKARLSKAEIAAILNYLRNQSNTDAAEINRHDVANVENTYGNRSQPWTTGELLK